MPSVRRAMVAVGAVAALAVPLAALAARDGAATSGAAPSFTRSVAPLVSEKCTGCHRVGGIAPFPLVTARQISSKASLVAAAVGSGVMPPWPPGRRSPAYVGEPERTLSAEQRATIVAWARAGGKVDGPARGAKPASKPDVRPGETLLDLRMASTYRPSARQGVTDDYRCFLLDPGQSSDTFVTSARIEPGQPRVVHHVILFRVPADDAVAARKLDAASPGQGWSCFGGTGLPAGSGGLVDSLNNANWVAAWAPGWGGAHLPDGIGVPLSAGSRIVMQMHYNLLNGHAPDRSRALLTVAPASSGLTPLQTALIPAPIELACAKSEHGPLCDRTNALFALSRKYGSQAAFVPAGLLLLCRGTAETPKPSPVSTCDRTIATPTTIRVVAGHMHLLGSSIRLELNPGTPRAKVLLDIPHWDFHWQNAYTLAKPVRAEPGDVVRVTCRYDVARRAVGHPGLPQTPRYVLWGEGTTDEMCLGIIQVTRP